MSVDIEGVAKYQRLLILAILVQLVAIGLAIVLAFGLVDLPILQTLIWPVRLGAAIFALIMLILLQGALGHSVVMRVLGAISQFIPLIGLIVLLVVNGKATAALSAAGYKVGLMGATK